MYRRKEGECFSLYVGGRAIHDYFAFCIFIYSRCLPDLIYFLKVSKVLRTTGKFALSTCVISAGVWCVLAKRKLPIGVSVGLEIFLRDVRSLGRNSLKAGYGPFRSPSLLVSICNLILNCFVGGIDRIFYHHRFSQCQRPSKPTDSQEKEAI